MSELVLVTGIQQNGLVYGDGRINVGDFIFGVRDVFIDTCNIRCYTIFNYIGVRITVQMFEFFLPLKFSLYFFDILVGNKQVFCRNS